jgi:hypothetical protein
LFAKSCPQPSLLTGPTGGRKKQIIPLPKKPLVFQYEIPTLPLELLPLIGIPLVYYSKDEDINNHKEVSMA